MGAADTLADAGDLQLPATAEARAMIEAAVRSLLHQRAQVDRFGVEVVDMPAFAPGVSHPEPGGLASREVLTLIQSLPGPVVGADVVELNPGVDAGAITAFLAAKLVKELADRMLATCPAPARSA